MKTRMIHPRRAGRSRARRTSFRWLAVLLIAAAVGILLAVFLRSRGGEQGPSPVRRLASSAPSTTEAAPRDPAAEPSQPHSDAGASETDLPKMEVAQAVMVTVELSFGPKIPTIAQALTEVERRYQPDDGAGRTFAILDAYGEPTTDGKLHMSMHVSSEKPGIASLVFKRTGEVLWRSRIVPASRSTTMPAKALVILLSAGDGKPLTVDGSNNPASILEAKIKELQAPVSSIWLDGQEREVTFIYSACGCPVKAMVRRVGDRTVRGTELPVMFPDDPAALATIARLMRW